MLCYDNLNCIWLTLKTSKKNIPWSRNGGELRILKEKCISSPNYRAQGFQSGPVPGTFTRLRSCIVPAEITEPPKISGGQNHKYDGR